MVEKHLKRSLIQPALQSRGSCEVKLSGMENLQEWRQHNLLWNGQGTC